MQEKLRVNLLKLGKSLGEEVPVSLRLAFAMLMKVVFPTFVEAGLSELR